MARRAALLLLFIAVTACSGEVVIPGESSAGTGGTGGSGGGGVGASTMVSSSSSSGTGGGIACGETHDAVQILLSRHDGHMYGCGAEAGDVEFDAEVAQPPDQNILVLDECSPASDCVGFFDKLSIQAPGFFTSLLPGTFVHVRFSAQPFMGGCSQRVQIDNLPKWDGAANPVEPTPLLWVLASDGIQGSAPGAPVVVDTVPLGCFPNDPPGCGDHEDYAFRFSPVGAPEGSITVGMGDTQGWTLQLSGGFQTLEVRNLRSFSVGICDGPVDFAYWMTRVKPID